MAENLTELRRVLSDPTRIGQERDEVIKSLTAAVNSAEDDAPMVQELVLRALSHRKAFGSLAPVIDSLARERGLYPYVDPEVLGLTEVLAYEAHRPFNLDEVVLHQAQTAIYDLLLRRENVILSAPTSFGKSLLIDAVIASEQYSQIVVVVPTIALIDETRRRLSKRFGNHFKIITHIGQSIAEKNIFVFTQERVLEYPELPKIDFFVIDEFYKLDPRKDTDRALLLNQAFYRLHRTGAQFYLLGPNIRTLALDLPERLNCRFIVTDYATVVSETTRINTTTANRLERLIALAKTLKEPTLIYCASPSSARRVATALAAAINRRSEPMGLAAEWIANEYHPDWVVGRALRSGIGVHHGRMPRSIAQFCVRAFNNGHLRFLVCTSTLIEGVNTKAKNVVVYDNRVATQKFDFFTFNNIRGRSGRMFEHFIGHVYLFNEPPGEELPLVDMPVFTQTDSAPPSLLVQIDESDLTPGSRARVDHVYAQSWLDVSIIRANNGIDPDAQIALARHIAGLSGMQQAQIAWSGFPTYDQLLVSCELIWDYLLPKGGMRGQAASGKQLAFRLHRYRGARSVHKLILQELSQQRDNPDADDAVESVLEFIRYWATFNFPRYLMALDRIQRDVLERAGRRAGNYSVFAAMLENQFLPAGVAALDEYGLPIQVAEKIADRLGRPDSLDVALERLRRMSPDQADELTMFERLLLADAISGI